MDKTYSKDEAVSLIKQKALEEEEMEKGKGSKGKGGKGGKSSGKGYSKTKREAPKSPPAKDKPVQDKPSKDKMKEATPDDVRRAFDTDERGFMTALQQADKNNDDRFVYKNMIYPTKGSFNIVNQIMGKGKAPAKDGNAEQKKQQQNQQQKQQQKP